VSTCAHYPALAGPLSVPAYSREDFAAFLPSLLEDLDRPW